MSTKFYIAPLMVLSFVSANAMDYTPSPEFKDANLIGQRLAQPLYHFDEEALEKELAELTDGESSTPELTESDLALKLLEQEFEEESTSKDLKLEHEIEQEVENFMEDVVMVPNTPAVQTPVQSYSFWDNFKFWNWKKK